MKIKGTVEVEVSFEELMKTLKDYLLEQLGATMLSDIVADKDSMIFYKWKDVGCHTAYYEQVPVEIQKSFDVLCGIYMTVTAYELTKQR